MNKKIAATLAAFLTAAATPADAAPAYKILCQRPGIDGAQHMEAYESAPGEMSVWYNMHAHISVFEPLIRGTPIGPDNVIRARIRSLGMDTNYHTVSNVGFATMTRGDYLRVFNTGAPGNPGMAINGFHCAVAPMHGRPRLLPFDPRSGSP